MTDIIPASISMSGGTTPPQALEAERAVLAAVMLSEEAVASAIEQIEPAVFYRNAHQKIFEAVLGLYNRNEKVDLITLSEELRKRGELEIVGGPAALSQVLDYAPAAANLQQHIRIIHSKAILRRLIKATSEIQQEAFAGSDETPSILDRAEQRIFAITDQRVREGFVPIRELLKPAFEHIQALFDRKLQVTGVTSGFPDLDTKTSGFQNSDLIIVAGRPAMGKCLRGDSLIIDADTGERITLECFVQEKRRRVMGVSERGEVRATEVSDWVDSGVQPCYRVTTRLGRCVEVTGHHPFLTVDGWTPLHDLAVGNRIGVPQQLPVFGDDYTWAFARIRLLAYFIAEGGLTSGCPHFTNTDPEIVADFHRCLHAQFPTCSTKVTGGITYRVATLAGMRTPGKPCRPERNPVTQWLSDLGLMGKLSEHKRLPEEVWCWPRERMAQLLRTLFSCDGTIYSLAGRPRIEFTVASEGLAQDVHHALCRFGIVAKLWRKTEKSWRVEITDPHAVQSYQQQIGWFGEKRHRFPIEPPDDLNSRHSNRGHAPPEIWSRVRHAAAGSGVTLTEVARRAGEPVGEGFNPHARRNLPRHRLRAYAAVLNDPMLERAASPDLYWDDILSIEPIGSHHVYDLTVPDGANFIANDVCVHNTSMAMNMAENAAIQAKTPVAIFSLEMSKEQLVQRLLCSQSGVALHRVRNGHLSNQDWPLLTTAAGLLQQAPIVIDDSPSLTLMEIRAKCRRLKSENRLGMLVIDYLQLIRSSAPAENRVQEISQITRGLKALAKELNIPIIALSQLSRAVETRDKSGRPQLSDLRESGSIEQDSDLVLFVYREVVYKPDTEEPGKASIIIAKQRNGPTGEVHLTFLNESTKFVPYFPTMREAPEPSF